MTFTEKIKLLFSKIWAFIWPSVKIFLTTSGVILADVAMKHVESIALSYADKNGAEKRDIAFKSIESELKERGIALASSTIYNAIEKAVQHLK